MKPSLVSRALRTLAIAGGQPLFVWGPPGCGKSSVVNQLAADLGIALRDIRALLLDPVDLRGLPFIGKDGRSQWATPDFLPQDGEGILFLDELNAAPAMVQASCYQLVLDRKLGEYTLPEGWAIVAAGNRDSDRAATTRMPPKPPRRLPSATARRPTPAAITRCSFPKEALAEIHKIVNEARQEHYFVTLPWDDNGYRVLPGAAYMDHTEKMRALSNRFTPAVDALVQQFGQLVEEAKIRLGGLFRPGDYPAPDELRSKFSFETKVMPLPDAGDFRVALGNEEKERIKRQITAAVEASLQVASRELWQRLYEAVSHLAERLQAYKVTEEGVEHPFRDSVVTNLVKLVDVLPKLNVTGDPELERLAAEVRASLVVDPEELRKSESVRNETAKAAMAISARMSAYMYSVPVTTTTTTTTTTDAGRAA